METISTDNKKQLTIEVPRENLPKMLGLLSPAFQVREKVGNTLKVFVCEQLGVMESYFEERIQTLFLNSKPVDDATTAVIHDGSILALSAAMPGLVGAIFRKGGQYSWMRKDISHKKENRDESEAQGWVTLKLFNLVMKELGPGFLERGAWISGGQLKSFLDAQSAESSHCMHTLVLDGAPLSVEALSATDLTQTSVFTKVVPV